MRKVSIAALVSFDKLFDTGFLANTTPGAEWALTPHRRLLWNTTSLRPAAASAQAVLIQFLAILTEGMPFMFASVKAFIFTER